MVACVILLVVCLLLNSAVLLLSVAGGIEYADCYPDV